MIERRSSGSPFAEWIRKNRIEQGLSQRELGRRTGLAHTTIGRLERGQMPTLATANQVVKGLREVFEEEAQAAPQNWLTTERTARKWSKGKLAERSGVSRATISRIEKGGRPSLFTVRRLRRAFQPPQG